ncbi:MAG: hypothetical protein II098_03670 [Treponema sp.]|nr:hypothetical protein [Treponema sp.]
MRFFYFISTITANTKGGIVKIYDKTSTIYQITNSGFNHHMKKIPHKLHLTARIKVQ